MSMINTPVNTGTGAFFERAKANMTALRSRADTLQEQLSTSSRLGSSSDDPVAASRMRSLARADQMATTDASNVGRANLDLGLTDSALTTFGNFITRAKELAVWAASDTLTDTQRASIGTELTLLRDNVVNLANTRDGSGYALFGGDASGAAYTLDASGNAVYAGNGNTGTVPIGDGQSITRAMTGPEILSFNVNGTPTDLMAVLKTLTEGIQEGASDPVGAARDAMGALDAGLQTVTTQQTIVGARMNWLDLVSDRATALSEQRAAEKSEVGGVDLASTVVDLQRAMLVLQTSQASFAKLSGLSLMNQLN